MGCFLNTNSQEYYKEQSLCFVLPFLSISLWPRLTSFLNKVDQLNSLYKASRENPGWRPGRLICSYANLLLYVHLQSVQLKFKFFMFKNKQMPHLYFVKECDI